MWDPVLRLLEEAVSLFFYWKDKSEGQETFRSFGGCLFHMIMVISFACAVIAALAKLIPLIF